MKSILLVAALSAVCLSAARSFEERVSRAKHAEESVVGKVYVQSMWNQVGADSSTAMHACFRHDSQPDTSAFVLVANVLPDRTLADAEVRPATPMTVCYAGRFAHAPFPAPPDIFGDSGIPIVIEMNIRP